MSEDSQTTLGLPSKEAIEAGAKAAYGTIFIDEERWPDVSGSVPASTYREAALRCYLAIVKMHGEKA